MVINLVESKSILPFNWIFSNDAFVHIPTCASFVRVNIYVTLRMILKYNRNATHSHRKALSCHENFWYTEQGLNEHTVPTWVGSSTGTAAVRNHRDVISKLAQVNVWNCVQQSRLIVKFSLLVTLRMILKWTFIVAWILRLTTKICQETADKRASANVDVNIWNLSRTGSESMTAMNSSISHNI